MVVRNFVGAFGHVAMDYIVTLRRLPTPNTSIEILDRERYFGGTAGNLARAAARLGVKVSLASFVGTDFPNDYREALERDGVDTTDLRTVRKTNTPSAWVFSDPKGNQMAIVDQGPMKEAGRLPLLRHSVQDVDLVHIGTGRRNTMCASQDSRRLWERPSHSIPRKKSTTCIRRGCSASCSIGRPTSLGTGRRSFERDGSHASRPPKGSSRPQRSLWPRADREEASSFRATAEFESRGFAPAKWST